ncbi:MAG: hypothetical protein ACP5U1_16350 [Desulfomonilaceae bacterium]
MPVSPHLVTSDQVFQETHLADFFCELGCKVILLESGLWHSTGSRIFQPLLMKGPIHLPSSEKKALWHGGSLFLRYPVPVTDAGIHSYIYLVDDKNYDLDSLPTKQRKETRRALKHCQVEQIGIDYIINNGMDLVKDTYSRQGRFADDWTLKWWKRNFEISARNPLFEAWGAFVGTELGAFRIDFTYRGGFYGDVLFNRRDLLKYQIMNALLFVSTREVIRRPEIDHVSYGIRATFGDRPTLNRFKESMGYVRIDIREKIEAAPILKPLLRMPGFRALGKFILSRYSEKSDKAKRLAAILDAVCSNRPG